LFILFFVAVLELGIVHALEVVKADLPVQFPIDSALLGLQAGQTAHFVARRGAQELFGEPVQAAMIGLLQVANPSLEAMHRPTGAPLAVGEGMLAIMSNDIDLAHQRMLEQEITVLFPPTKSADGSESEMVVYDPDGVRIHVVERHLTKK
jgi:catechol 2,3-dioxygenase-like lactoylglutathione lyase family enzyme